MSSGTWEPIPVLHPPQHMASIVIISRCLFHPQHPIHVADRIAWRELGVGVVKGFLLVRLCLFIQEGPLSPETPNYLLD